MLNIHWLDASFEAEARASERVFLPDIAMATDYAFALFKATGRDVGGARGFVMRDEAGAVVDMWRTDGAHAKPRAGKPRAALIATPLSSADRAAAAEAQAHPPAQNLAAPRRARHPSRRMPWQNPALYRPAVAALVFVCLAGIYAPPSSSPLVASPRAAIVTVAAAAPSAAARRGPGDRLDGEGRSVYVAPLPQGPPGGYAPVAAPERSLSALPVPAIGEVLGGRVPPPIAGGRREQEAMVPPAGPSAVPRVHHRRSSKRTRDDKARRV